MQTSVAQPTLISALWPQGQTRVWRALALAVAGSLLLTISAKIQIPFFPVPLTMQTYVVLLIGMAFGSRLGAATVILYLAEGAVGLPVFTGTPERGLGLAYMVGPTGGYLLGYVAAAYLSGFLAERGWDRNVAMTAAAALAADVLVFVPGILWLGVLFGWDKPILEWGFYPFALGDLTKVLLAACTTPLAWKLLSRIRG